MDLFIPWILAYVIDSVIPVGSLRLIFADDGRGYPPAVLAQLQGAAAPDAPAPHILGLYLVRQIVRAHGGQAAFAQNRPRGALCTLTLPLAPAGGPPVQ